MNFCQYAPGARQGNYATGSWWRPRTAAQSAQPYAVSELAKAFAFPVARGHCPQTDPSGLSYNTQGIRMRFARRLVVRDTRKVSYWNNWELRFGLVLLKVPCSD